jgi:hypothetical protein
MGITQLIDPFYEELPREEFRRRPIMGQLCWVPSPHLNVIPQIFEIQRADPTEHHIGQFKIRNVKETDFQRRDELPLYKLKLRLHEELIIQKAKKRPAIVLITTNTIFQDIGDILRSQGKLHLQEDSILVLPIYGIEKPEHPGGFPPIMTTRVKALRYNQFFFCPRTPGRELIEGVARLDRLQIVFPGHRASYNPLPIKLTNDAFLVLMEMMRAWLCIKGTPENEKYLSDLKEILKETLPDHET